jgi:hypothetical protein
MSKSISLLVVLAALAGCTTSPLGGTHSIARSSSMDTRSMDTKLIGPMGRGYDCYYKGNDGGKYVAQCPSGYH